MEIAKIACSNEIDTLLRQAPESTEDMPAPLAAGPLWLLAALVVALAWYGNDLMLPLIERWLTTANHHLAVFLESFAPPARTPYL